MIVDCHTHIRLSGGEAELFEHLEASRAVDGSIVHAMPEGHSDGVNRELSELVHRHPDRLVGFAVIDPRVDKVNVKGLRSQTTKLNLQGVVLYCCETGVHPTHSRAMQLYESAAELKLPVYFHNEEGFLQPAAVLEYAQPYLLDEIARTFPELRIVIGSMGAPFLDQTLAMAGKHEYVYADLTIRPGSVWHTYNTVVAAHERGVMHKLLFGSGFPFGRAWECMETLLGFNMLLADTSLPAVPRATIRNVVERDALDVLGIEHEAMKARQRKSHVAASAKPVPEA